MTPYDKPTFPLPDAPAEQKQAYDEWLLLRRRHFNRSMLQLEAEMNEDGSDDGQYHCKQCGKGTVTWYRTPLRAKCSTENCFHTIRRET